MELSHFDEHKSKHCQNQSAPVGCGKENIRQKLFD